MLISSFAYSHFKPRNVQQGITSIEVFFTLIVIPAEAGIQKTLTLFHFPGFRVALRLHGMTDKGVTQSSFIQHSIFNILLFPVQYSEF
jgi:hypothetical protein